MSQEVNVTSSCWRYNDYYIVWEFWRGGRRPVASLSCELVWRLTSQDDVITIQELKERLGSVPPPMEATLSYNPWRKGEVVSQDMRYRHILWALVRELFYPDGSEDETVWLCQYNFLTNDQIIELISKLVDRWIAREKELAK